MYESFGECLQRILEQEGLSASKVARMVGFRSRNSLFRILSGETSVEVDGRFLAQLREAMAPAWPAEYWDQLETALEVKRVGLQQHVNNQVFYQGMCMAEAQRDFRVDVTSAGVTRECGLDELLREACREGEVSVVMCGCCERSLMALLASSLSDAAAGNRLSVRHYIDVSGDAMVQHIMHVLPLLSKPWYNARLVDDVQCPAEMAAMYRVNMLCVYVTHPDGGRMFWHLLQYDKDRFACMMGEPMGDRLLEVLDRYRFQMEILKPRKLDEGGPQDFVEYTRDCAALEQDCMILSVKPDLHFNLVPTELLYQAIMEGFSQSGLVDDGGALQQLMAQLYTIHEGRVRNMYDKHRPTHIVYSLPVMERFACTGVQSDHFFIQRAYTPQERRAILCSLLTQMQENPYFNIYFLRPELPEIRNEFTFYEGRGVLIMDAYTSYDLHDDHSEALVTQPDFQHSFQQFFQDSLLARMVLSRQESLACLERLIALVP